VKVGILAGGFGTRLAEETEVRPKPMVEIGAMPILWHIMKIYAAYGHEDFVVALGYKGEYIKRYMADFASLSGSLSINTRSGAIRPHTKGEEIPDWHLDLIDTGGQTNTGGRIKRLQPYMGDETFMLTWGDGVSDIDLDKLLEFHREHGKLATLTAVRPPARFGHIEIGSEGEVHKFTEKPQIGEGWINGAFFVCEPGVFDYIDGDATQFEKEPLEALANDGQLMAYQHTGFWQCMDTMRDKYLLNNLWDAGKAPWKTWEN
jgi:glucose-1-phosphate cytidylyltransferase